MTDNGLLTTAQVADLLNRDRRTIWRYRTIGLPGGIGKLTPAMLANEDPDRPLYARKYVEAIARLLPDERQRGRPRKAVG